jgi:hypothetical protein
MGQASERQQKYLYIAGLGHSGSTVLATLLARHTDVVAVGEIPDPSNPDDHRNIHNVEERPCTCGRNRLECPVWSAYLGEGMSVEQNGEGRLTSFIRSKALAEYAGIVDSTKLNRHIPTLAALHRAEVADVHVILLMKDVRSWIDSMCRNRLRKGTRIIPLLSHMRIALSWYRANRRTLALLRTEGVQYHILGYEQLCRDPHGVLETLYKQTGLSIDAERMEGEPTMHMLYGNQARHDKRRIQNVTYDTRWMENYWISLAVVLLPFVFLWNRRQVHRSDTN